MHTRSRINIETFKGGKILHDPDHGCLVLIDPQRSDPRRLARPLQEFARESGYGKLSAWVPASHSGAYTNEGYSREARIGGHYRGTEDCLVMSCFPDAERSRSLQAARRDAIINQALEEDAALEGRSGRRGGHRHQPDDQTLVRQLEDGPKPQAFRQAAGLEPEPEEWTGLEGRQIWGLERQGSLMCIAWIQTCKTSSSARVGGFLTMPDRRRQGLASILLGALLEEGRTQGLCSVHACVPAANTGMNLCLGYQNFRFGGTLVNHLRHSSEEAGQAQPWEDLNIWYRRLGRD